MPGEVADLIVLDQDIDDGLRALRDPRLVVKAGEIVHTRVRFGAGDQLVLYAADGRDVSSSTGMFALIVPGASRAGSTVRGIRELCG